MTGVRAAGSVALLQGLYHWRIADGTSQAAISYREQFVIPLPRHPQLHADFFAYGSRNAAEIGNLNCGPGRGDG